MKTVVLQRNSIHTGNLILVNSQYPYRENEMKHNLTPVYEREQTILLGSHVVRSLSKLMNELNGWNYIFAVSGWRSRKEQEHIFIQSLRDKGILFTNQFVALPGHSEHQTGLAIDLARKQENIDFICPDFPYTGICQNFREKAAQFGLIERYPKGKEAITGIAHEPWHFRYVGRPHAEIMKETGLVLEEYIAFLKQYPYGERHYSYHQKQLAVSISYLEAKKQGTPCLKLTRLIPTPFPAAMRADILLPSGGISMKDYRKLGGLDYFKLIAAFLVIAIHTSALSSFDPNADFVLTRIIARIAVPFFLMTTGYFLLPAYLFSTSTDFKPLLRWIKKALLLYSAAIALYLPVNLYAGQLKGVTLFDILRMFIFDGTFYHLWYFPASILGILLVYLMSRRLPAKAVMGIALLLYMFGLFGDSYFGLIANFPYIKIIYDTLFHIFSYTRNGIFYAPIFLIMGAWMTRIKCPELTKLNIAGLILSFAFMLWEGLVLHSLQVQRHDSMYISLLPCMFFLFPMILSVKTKPVKCLRTLSTWIYLVHPLFIILVRGGAKEVHLEAVLIDNSLIHYLAVSVLSCIFSIFLTKLPALIKHRNPSHKERAWIELSRENLRQNVNMLQNLLPPGCRLMPAVKANAYGHGAVLTAKELNACGVKAFCVATVREGAELRCHGVKGEILVLGYTDPNQFPLLRKYHLIQTVVDYPYARLLNDCGKKMKVHLNIDTGMHRLGIRSERIDQISQVFQCKNLLLEGIYTHLCAADTASPADRKFTAAQGKSFFHVIRQLKKRGYYIPKIHLQASCGLLNYPEFAGDYARIGIALYGLLSSRAEKDCCAVRLAPILSVMAKVASVKNVYQGEEAGYGLQYTAEQDKKIAVLTIGYADGLPRSLSCGIGKVLIHGCQAPIIGRICMDQTLVDITDIKKVTQGDIAVILGTSGDCEITAYDIAEQAGTITNEVLSRLSTRLDRIIV